jgi:hypothetical protein
MYSATANRAFARGVEPLPVVHLVLQGGKNDSAAVVAASGRTKRRNRMLPARVTAYFSIGMALYSEGSYEDVLGQLTDGLAWASGWSDPGSDSEPFPT